MACGGCKVLFLEACLFQLDKLVECLSNHLVVAPDVAYVVSNELLYRCRKTVVRNRPKGVSAGGRSQQNEALTLLNQKYTSISFGVSLCLFFNWTLQGTPLIKLTYTLPTQQLLTGSASNVKYMLTIYAELVA